MWPSRPCHRFESPDSIMFTAPSRLIIISGYKLLYLTYPFPIFILPWLIIRVDSLRVILYPSSASMPMETRLSLFSTGTCRTWCMVIVLPLGNSMRTSPVPSILYSSPLLSQSVALSPVKWFKNHSMFGVTWNVAPKSSSDVCVSCTL